MKTKLLIAGLAGASLGTEILKCLSEIDEYDVYGCDIAPLAYGLYSNKLIESFLVDKENYIKSVLDICLSNGIRYIIPGGEQPMVLLAKNHKSLHENGIILIGNSHEIVELFSSKEKTFDYLRSIGVDIPYTKRVKSNSDLDGVHFPCIVKPSSGTGGSESVFLAASKEECSLYVELLISNGREVIIQEYINLEEGEFTIGVLSDVNARVIGSVAMKRIFDSKLSIAYKGPKGLISSGYSQGLIADFKDIRLQAEYIARKVGSKGPLNIQGRIKNGRLVPFEINPRFSASTYLRKLAGFNEIHFFIQFLVNNKIEFKWNLREGYYLRSFEELYMPINKVKVSP